MSEQEKTEIKLQTVDDYLQFAVAKFKEADLFFGHGTDSAWDDAVFLVLRTVGLAPDSDDSVLDIRLSTKQRKEVINNIKKRCEMKLPTPYILNETWFAGMEFYIDERAIIPRSPIAELIEEQFYPWVTKTPRRILDLCTGSGCIAIACALFFPETPVDASDISSDALEVAKINREKYQLTERVNLIQSDLFENINQQYDLIICNPPYVSQAEIDKLPHEYDYEPKLALAGGDHDGLALVKKIFSQAVNYLHDDGILIVEVGHSEAALCERYPNAPFMWLEFEYGGQGVLMLTKEQLRDVS